MRQSYPSFNGVPDECPLTQEQRERIANSIKALSLSLPDNALFVDEVLGVAELYQRLAKFAAANTKQRRLYDIERALGVGHSRARGSIRLSAPNVAHYGVLRRLRPEAEPREILQLIRQWLMQQRPGRGRRPHPERYIAVQALARVWRRHVSEPTSTPGSSFSQLLVDIFRETTGHATAGELHNLIHLALSKWSTDDGEGHCVFAPAGHEI